MDPVCGVALRDIASGDCDARIRGRWENAQSPIFARELRQVFIAHRVGGAPRGHALRRHLSARFDQTAKVSCDAAATTKCSIGHGDGRSWRSCRSGERADESRRSAVAAQEFSARPGAIGSRSCYRVLVTRASASLSATASHTAQPAFARFGPCRQLRAGTVAGKASRRWASRSCIAHHRRRSRTSCVRRADRATHIR